MRNLLREYGLIALLIVIAMTGYLIYYQGTGDIFYASLNVVGDRLITMVTGGDNASDVIDQLKTRVFGRNDDVLASERAPAEAAPAVTSPSPTVETAPSPLSPTLTPAPIVPPETQALAAAQTGGVSFAEEIRLVFPDDPELSEKLGEHVRLNVEDGLRVIIDNEVKEMMSEADRKRLLAAIRKFEQQIRVQWSESLADVVRKRIDPTPWNTEAGTADSRDVRDIPTLQTDPAQRIALALVQKRALAFRITTQEKARASLAALRHMAALRRLSPTKHDAMRRAVQSAMDETLARADEASGALVRHAGRETFATAMETYRRKLDAYRASYEARLASMLDSLETATENRGGDHPRAPFAATYARTSARRSGLSPDA